MASHAENGHGRSPGRIDDADLIRGVHQPGIDPHTQDYVAGIRPKSIPTSANTPTGHITQPST